jgi:hypothetical protein
VHASNPGPSSLHSGANFLPDAPFRGAMDIDPYDLAEPEQNGAARNPDSHLTPVEYQVTSVCPSAP